MYAQLDHFESFIHHFAAHDSDSEIIQHKAKKQKIKEDKEEDVDIKPIKQEEKRPLCKYGGNSFDISMFILSVAHSQMLP